MAKGSIKKVVSSKKNKVTKKIQKISTKQKDKKTNVKGLFHLAIETGGTACKVGIM